MTSSAVPPTAESEVVPAPPRRRRIRTVLVLGMLALALGAGLYLYLQYAAGRETTDDAQIEGPIHAVSARVGGTVIKTPVENNQKVEAGTVLAEIDPKDYQVAVARAKADLAEAQADLLGSRTQVPIISTAASSGLSSAVAGVSEAQANIATAGRQVDAAQARLRASSAMVRAAKANADRTARDLERMKILVAKEEISQQQFDAASSAADASRAQLEATEAQVSESEQSVRVAQSHLEEQRAKLGKAEADATGARTGPQQIASAQARAESSSAKVMKMKAALEQAEINLGFTVVRAPVSGIVSQRSVEVGQTVQAGQPLLAVVPLEDVWVVANFKENQLKHLRPGQKATVSVDAYGKTYAAHVDSISAATGARFSLLPPENATGNYVKVVQRVPVKIFFEKGQDPDHLLRPGLSVSPVVTTR
jgi:membrane fusion protein (multidrug efflux system)